MSHTKAIKSVVPPHIPRSHHSHDAKSGHHIVTKDTIKAAARTTAAGVLLAVGVSLVVQVIYPRSMALPQTYIGGKQYGFKSQNAIAADITAIQDRKLRINSGSETVEMTPAQLGISLAGRADAEQAVQYSWRERLVPFSLFFERRNVPHYSFTIDEKKAKQTVSSLQKHDKPPVDAAVRLDGVKVVVEKQQNGYIYDADQLVQALKELKITSSLYVELRPTVVQPKITDQAASEAALELQQRLQQPVTVQAAGKILTADPAMIASWTILIPDASNQKMYISYDKEKIGHWMAGLANQVYQAGTSRTVTMVDGEVVHSTEATDGAALDVGATTDAFIAAVAANKTTVEGVVRKIAANANMIRNYTRSSKGLQALLNYWDASNAGTWGVVLQETGGSISASINPDRQFTSASVYKLYVAYVVYAKADNGELSMTTPTGNGNTVAGCLDVMIRRSDNPCAEELGHMVGWGANNGMLHARGLNATSIQYGHQLTTARDAAKYLVQLHSGTLMGAANRSALLDMMGNNIYRFAIPAGSPGMYSVNKIGTMGTLHHDVAIVYHPKGTYVLSVFTQGSSHDRVRELARQIADVMGR